MVVNARLEAVMIEARCKGFEAIGASISRMREEITLFSNERYILLQEGNFEHIKKIESMYADLTNDLNNNDFLIVRMPQMLEIASKYPEDSDLHKLYMKGIELEMVNSINFKNEQIRFIATRCQQAIDSTNASKAQMNEHINKLIEQTNEIAIKTLHTNTQLKHNEAVTQITDNSSNQLKIDHKS
jgi:RNase adaptor protein for sRNA GlmZ degradation